MLIGSLILSLAPTPALAQSEVNCTTDAIVRSGDTLSKLANQYYGSMLAYPQIIEATNAKAAVDPSYAAIANPNTLEVGWKLCIANSLNSQTAPSEPVSTVANQTAPFDVLAIPALRHQTFPGSAITVEQALPNGTNYRRYITSYRSQGLKIYALFTAPLKEKPRNGWPVIVFNHGYSAPELYRPDQGYNEYVDAFARNGYIVFRPDYRGYGRSEGDRAEGVDAPDYTVDVLNAVASVKQYPDADPSRIGMWGHSLGGYITLRVMVVSKDIKAGVIWAGVVGSYTELLAKWGMFSSLLPSGVKEWYSAIVAVHGTPLQNSDYWATTSANNYLADLSGPIQLHHSTTDPSVPIEFSDSLYQQIQAAGKPVEYYKYPDDDHNLDKSFPLAMQRTVTFFDKYLKAQS